MKSLLKSKKGSFELVNSTVGWGVGLIILVIIGLVIVSTLTGAGLLTSGSAEDNATDQLVSNFTTGINTISNKIPTVMLVAAVVLILGILLILWGYYKRMNMGGGSLG